MRQSPLRGISQWRLSLHQRCDNWACSCVSPKTPKAQIIRWGMRYEPVLLILAIILSRVGS